MKKAILAAAIILAYLAFSGTAEAIDRKAVTAEKLYLQGDYQSAAYECERLLRQDESDEFKCEVSGLAALCYLKLGDNAKAKRFFEFVTANSDDSLLIAEAQAGLENVSEKSAPPAQSAAAAEPSYYAIQVGSFKNRSNAARLFSRFKRRKYTVRITEEKDGSVSIYKVKIGRFKTKEDAVVFARKLQKTGQQTAIVPY